MNKNGELKLPLQRDIQGHGKLSRSTGTDALSVFAGLKKQNDTTNEKLKDNLVGS